MIKHYLKDTCSDCWLAHTCLCAVTITNVSRHLCEEVTSLEVGWIMSLEHSCLLLSLARGSFWYKCPLCTFDCENFSPHPPSPSLHPCFIHFTRTHMIPLYLEQVSYERRNHLRLFRLGLTRVLPIFLWYGWVIWIPYPIVTVEPIHFEVWPFLWRSDFSSWDSWKESVTVRRLQHLLTEATSQKSNLHPSQGEKECAACLLMIKHYLKDTCSDCYLSKGILLSSSISAPIRGIFPTPPMREKKILKQGKTTRKRLGPGAFFRGMLVDLSCPIGYFLGGKGPWIYGFLINCTHDFHTVNFRIL